MEIRKSRPEDLPELAEIYQIAREYMRTHGNPNQWGNTNPPLSRIRQDVEEGIGYVLEEGGRIQGTFAFFLGGDPTYRVIYGGEWLSDAPYGTIHRVASRGEIRGITRAIFDRCATVIPHLRIDTHRDNLTMQRALERYGFRRCGIIHLMNGDERIAYEYIGSAAELPPLPGNGKRENF